MPSTPETKSPEQQAAESAQATAKAEIEAAQEAGRIAADAANAAEQAKTEKAGAKAKAEQEAATIAAGGQVENQFKKAEPNRVKEVAKYGAAFGVAGAMALNKIAGPVVDWLGDKLNSAWEYFDIWDLSGRKAASKKKK